MDDGKPRRTMFHDVAAQAVASYEIRTESSEYVVDVYVEDDRKVAVIRGKPGTDRENVVVRDSDPRIGPHALFDLPVTDWLGYELRAATMQTSPIIEARRTDAAKEPMPAVGLRGPLAIAPLGSNAARGTVQHPAPSPYANARRVVIGGEPAPPPVPYPERYVRYAEDCANLLRAISRRELWNDLAGDSARRARVSTALTDCDRLLAEIRRTLH